MIGLIVSDHTRSKRTMSEKSKKFASKWFRVATAGATVDGRVISADHLRQMAKNFNPATYGARVWVEHLRGLYPDSMFSAVGDVIGLKAEDQDGKTRLFAQIEPTERLIQMNKARQKIYTSIEIEPKFADTGEAYMVGLAVTDSPASLGTEALAFTVGSKRPDDMKNHLFSAAEETAMEFTEVPDEPEADATGPLVAAFTSVLKAFGLKPEGQKPETPPAVTTPAAAFNATELQAAFAGLQSAITEQTQATQATVTQLTADLKAQAAQIEAFRADLAQLQGQPDPAHQHRRNTGPGGDAIKTDC